MPERKTDAALRLPISGIYKIKGVGDVLAGRVEQGIVKPGDEVIFMPTHTASRLPCVNEAVPKTASDTAQLAAVRAPK